MPIGAGPTTGLCGPERQYRVRSGLGWWAGSSGDTCRRIGEIAIAGTAMLRRPLLRASWSMPAKSLVRRQVIILRGTNHLQ
jgi:hypothetical protein